MLFLESIFGGAASVAPARPTAPEHILKSLISCFDLSGQDSPDNSDIVKESATF